jgi:hypothetical protein
LPKRTMQSSGNFRYFKRRQIIPHREGLYAAVGRQQRWLRRATFTAAATATRHCGTNRGHRGGHFRIRKQSPNGESEFHSLLSLSISPLCGRLPRCIRGPSRALQPESIGQIPGKPILSWHTSPFPLPTPVI